MTTEGAKTITELVSKGVPCLIGRFGSTELEGLYIWHLRSRPREALLPKPPSGIPQSCMTRLEQYSGLFPAEESSFLRWAEAYKSAIQNSDAVAAGWFSVMEAQEKEVLHAWGFSGAAVKLRDLEPYYTGALEDRWTRALAGKRVCVVTSFAETAGAQVKKGEGAIWPGAGGSLWSAGVQWSFVQTGFPPSIAQGVCGWQEGEESWEQCVATVMREVRAAAPDVVLIGCGALGMPIGELCKRDGRVAIVMGGALQVLFGIRGGRWVTHSVISKFWNDEWVWPADSETPGAARSIEGGCYW